MNRSANDNVRHWHASYNTTSAAQPNIGHILSQYGSSQRALASEYGSEFLAKSDKVEDVTNQASRNKVNDRQAQRKRSGVRISQSTPQNQMKQAWHSSDSSSEGSSPSGGISRLPVTSHQPSASPNKSEAWEGYDCPEAAMQRWPGADLGQQHRRYKETGLRQYTAAHGSDSRYTYSCGQTTAGEVPAWWAGVNHKDSSLFLSRDTQQPQNCSYNQNGAVSDSEHRAEGSQAYGEAEQYCAEIRPAPGSSYQWHMRRPPAKEEGAVYDELINSQIGDLGGNLQPGPSEGVKQRPGTADTLNSSILVVFVLLANSKVEAVRE
ncbi:hypothetical protein CYMTET_16538 [Cymbomonas tetramitiformis]|uniref:Uncharacterized protein n=1 Tax=Cymbomonas tetramitiformis TaxID=36881 RepID=A0AAE0GCA6_9CHLO|nr:hypothetical protein CYMTET_16538 [Cymbomonas tetramitiformis]